MIRNRLERFFKANAKRGQAIRAEGNTVYLYDVIVGSQAEADWYGCGIAPESFAKALAGMNGDVHLRIDSPGGDVFGGSAICQAIREYSGGEVIAHIDGVAASIASVIAVATKKCVIAPSALMMIHNAWTVVGGDANALIKTADLLAKIDGTIAASYAAKSGKDAQCFADWMNAETWFTAQEAIDAGLADEAAPHNSKQGDQQKTSCASATRAWDFSVFDHAPQALRDAKPAPQSDPAPQGDPAPAPIVDSSDDDFERRLRIHAARLLTITA
jgi:ATP-dependent Clp protease protease subunit